MAGIGIDSVSVRRPLTAEQVSDFRRRIGGDVLLPDDAGYDEARTVWNAMIDRYPQVIIRCSSVADVIEAVRLAREHGLAVSVKAGGHHVAGTAIVDAGLVIDLSTMKGVRVDPEARTARVQPGVRWGELDRETQAFGLAVPGGQISDTGVAGLTLGGGFGWLARKYGLACDNLRSVDVVTADGELVHAGTDEREDLFWALRGGSGNFGIVTSFEFDLHEVGPEVVAGTVFHRFDDAASGLRTYRDFLANAPREAAASAGLKLAPSVPFLPAEVHGEPILGFTLFYGGDPDDADNALAPLRSFGEPLADLVSVRTYVSAQRLLDAPNARGAHNYLKSHFLDELTDSTIDSMIERAMAMPRTECAIGVNALGGAINDVETDATAYAHRHARYLLTANARWHDPTRDEEHVAWARRTFETLRPAATGGAYVNFLSPGEERVRAAYGDNYGRLVAVKNEYDPENFFRANQNVEPTVDAE